MAARMREKNWAETPLGPPDRWSQSLRTVVRILLTSRYQMWMGWGAELTFFYNDAYLPTLGVKHDWALGVSTREVWKEIWPDIGPRIEHVLRTGEATWDAGLLLILERSGFPEETYHTFSYSPLADDDGAVVGIFCVVMEETERVIGERRLLSLRELASEIAGKNTRADVLAAAERQLAANCEDLPFTLTYLLDQDGTAKLACATGASHGDSIAPDAIDPEAANAAWPFREALAGRVGIVVPDLASRFGNIPAGAWDKPPRDAVIAPIARQGQEAPAGFFVTGPNPYRPLDEPYLGFIRLVAGQIASGLANAAAYEEERRRSEALAEIDRAKTLFFSNVSHEFRTPLTLMLGPLEEVLAETGAEAPAEHRALIQVAHRNGVRLLKLVNTLLEFSRIEAGRMQADYEPIDLAAFTAELASSFRSTIERAGAAPGRRLSAVAGTGLRQPGHVGENRPQPAFERVQIYLRWRNQGRVSGFPRWELRRSRGSRQRDGHSHRGTAALVRTVSPRGRRSRALDRRQRHRSGAGAGIGQAPRRGDPSGEPSRGGDRLFRCRAFRARSSAKGADQTRPGHAGDPPARASLYRRGLGMAFSSRNRFRRAAAAVGVGRRRRYRRSGGRRGRDDPARRRQRRHAQLCPEAAECRRLSGRGGVRWRDGARGRQAQNDRLSCCPT